MTTPHRLDARVLAPLVVTLTVLASCGSDPEPAADPAADAAAAPHVAADAAPEATTTPPEAVEVPIGAQDDTFATGPYVMHTTQTGASIAWETEVASDTVVEVGLDDTYGARLTGEAGTMHRVELTGLEAGTLYHYRACSDGTCSADLVFATAPVPSQPFRFAVYGDSRSDPPQHRAVVDSIIESAPALVFHTGDIVETGQRHEYREMHFDPVRRLGHHVPVYVAIGNHEWKELDEVATFRDYLVYPKDAPVPRPGLNYAVTWGDAFFVVMDNTLDGLDFFFPVGAHHDPPLWDWLVEQAGGEEARAAKWRFAFFHYPPGSPCHEDWAMMLATRDHVLPLLRDNGFTAIFAGHVHDYERHDYDGFPVIITGGGGAGLEPLEHCTRPSDTLQVIESVHHHVTVDISADSAFLQAVSITGEIIDTLTFE